MCPLTVDLTRDAFLGGRLQIWQPRNGYRAGVDPVLLAAAVHARSGQSVLELGCGAGVAMLCLARRVPGLDLTGVELQTAYADLARRNAQENGIAARIVQSDLTDLPDDLRARSFDHVIANPPYYQRRDGSAAADAGRDIALAGETPLDAWVDAAARRLAPKGYATFIQRADRLPDLLAAMQPRLGSLRLRPLQPRMGRPASLVIVQGRKGGRAGFELAAPITLHDGAEHLRDGDDYAPDIADVLRNGAALPD